MIFAMDAGAYCCVLLVTARAPPESNPHCAMFFNSSIGHLFIVAYNLPSSPTRKALNRFFLIHPKCRQYVSLSLLRWISAISETRKYVVALLCPFRCSRGRSSHLNLGGDNKQSCAWRIMGGVCVIHDLLWRV